MGWSLRAGFGEGGLQPGTMPQRPPSKAAASFSRGGGSLELQFRESPRPRLGAATPESIGEGHPVPPSRSWAGQAAEALSGRRNRHRGASLHAGLQLHPSLPRRPHSPCPSRQPLTSWHGSALAAQKSPPAHQRARAKVGGGTRRDSHTQNRSETPPPSIRWLIPGTVPCHLFRVSQGVTGSPTHPAETKPVSASTAKGTLCLGPPAWLPASGTAWETWAFGSSQQAHGSCCLAPHWPRLHRALKLPEAPRGPQQRLACTAAGCLQSPSVG